MKRISILLSSFLALTGLFGCSTLEKARSTFFGDPRPDYSFLNTDETPYSRSLPKHDRERLSTLWELKQLEARLTPAERSQYLRVKPSLNSDRRRVEFLKQGSLSAKEAWALEQNIYIPEDSESNLVKAGGNLRPGMNADQVRDLLGEPEAVETAGAKRYGNERWIYADTSVYGPSRQTYFIYFENGRVAGWQATR